MASLTWNPMLSGSNRLFGLLTTIFLSLKACKNISGPARNNTKKIIRTNIVKTNSLSTKSQTWKLEPILINIKMHQTTINKNAPTENVQNITEQAHKTYINILRDQVSFGFNYPYHLVLFFKIMK